MINLRNSPFLWIALMLLFSFWITGLFLPVMEDSLRYSLYALCCLLAFVSFQQYSPSTQYRSTLSLGLLIFLAGFLRLEEYRKEIYSGELITGSVYVEGALKVKQVLKNKDASVSLRCQRLVLLHDKDSTKSWLDKYYLLYIKKTSPARYFPGDILRIKGRLSPIQKPMNPFAFDARVYYNTMGIRHQVFCKQDDVTKETSADFSIARITAKWQGALTDIARNNLTPQVSQLTNALVWGDRSDMDAEIRDAFADTGAMHVLSVSGMHVAIIYSMLLYILGAPGAGSFMQRIFRFACYSFAIILYMGLTGACPAVVRASLMIILYLFGKSMGWNTQIWNLLGFAAFFMLWLSPFVWQNIGFQLSFLALAGILLFAKPIIRSLSFKNKILHLTWEITALSIAAQVFILPILLSQFHQFPLTFIVSSIVAIPAAYVVMAGALLCTTLSFLNLDFLWPALNWSGLWFIKIMQWMSAYNPGMHFSLPGAGSLALMSMAVLFSFGVVFRWKAGKKLAWLCGLITLISLGYNRYHQWSSGDLVIYHSPKGLMMDITTNGFCYSLLDCSLPHPNIEFMARNFRSNRDIIRVSHFCNQIDFEENNIRHAPPFLVVSEKIFLFWNDTMQFDECRQVTHLVVDNTTNLDDLKNYILQTSLGMVVLPAHLNRNFRNELLAHLAEHNIPFHDINEKGYYHLLL